MHQKVGLCNVFELKVERRFCLISNDFVVAFFYYKITCEQAIVKNSVSFTLKHNSFVNLK